MPEPCYFGDCLEVMREEMPDACVDLIYADPPFNSKRLYNAYIGGAQWEAFNDTWRPVEHPMPEPIPDHSGERRSRHHAESAQEGMAIPEGIRAQALMAKLVIHRDISPRGVSDALKTG